MLSVADSSSGRTPVSGTGSTGSNPVSAANTVRLTYTVVAWPVRLVAQDTALSRLKQGFDSPTGYHAMRQVRDAGSPLRALGCGKLNVEGITTVRML